jgi:hypothetical protein
MTWLSLLLTVLKAVGSMIGFYRQSHDENMGAANQRADDLEKENTDVANAAKAAADPALLDDDGMRDDPNNRSRSKRK